MNCRRYYKIDGKFYKEIEGNQTNENKHEHVLSARHLSNRRHKQATDDKQSRIDNRNEPRRDEYRKKTIFLGKIFEYQPWNQTRHRRF